MTHEKNLYDIPVKLMKHFTNGITHNLILWIISKETIHGYGIMKKLEEFFSFQDSKCDININSSKIYPILSEMEKNGLVIGEWNVNENNKRVKYYSITDDGLAVLKHIQNTWTHVLENPAWVEFIEDMTQREINDEKRN